MYIDVSDIYSEKIDMILNYKSQFVQSNVFQKTYLNTKFLEKIKAKDHYCGLEIGTEFAEQLIVEVGHIEFNNLFQLLN